MRIQKIFKNPLKEAQRKSSTSRSRARNIARQRVVHARFCKRRSFVKCSKLVSDKLEALKTLIPHHVQNGSNEIVEAEQLFQETANYIIVLKTQVFVLQKLIEFYDDDDGSRNAKQNLVQQDQS
ncbi:uncharacterized protein LOC111293370 [Durio zibethinus]|uniref:Uncharacterized protein LOC111293370 n=1 Tax=Durio zibethinus TaxID=66656 RepID=A0A6P5YNI7_DURZI|nr:uncharacterized protein LOC111293370 [Durio zibethinus]